MNVEAWERTVDLYSRLRSDVNGREYVIDQTR